MTPLKDLMAENFPKTGGGYLKLQIKEGWTTCRINEEKCAPRDKWVKELKPNYWIVKCWKHYVWSQIQDKRYWLISIWHCTWVPGQCRRAIQIEKEDLEIFADAMIVYVKKLEDSADKLFNLIRKFWHSFWI